MKSIFLAILLSFITLSAISAPKPPIKNKHEQYHLSNSCTVLVGEFDNVQIKSFSVSPNKPFKQCILFRGQTNGVGLMLKRGSVNLDDKVNLGIIPGSYSGWGAEPDWTPHAIEVSDVSGQVFDISYQAQKKLGDAVAIMFSADSSSKSRQFVIFYETTADGTLLTSVTLSPSSGVQPEIGKPGPLLTPTTPTEVKKKIVKDY